MTKHINGLPPKMFTVFMYIKNERERKKVTWGEKEGVLERESQ